MKIKDGASLIGLKLPMRKVLIIADELWKDAGKELVVTEGTGGTHSAGSLHPFGYAVDLRSRYFDTSTQRDVASALRLRLGPDYDVVVHKTHVHVEYQKILEMESVGC